MWSRTQRKAMSAVLSTIILSAAILSITMAAIFVSNFILGQQLDQSEFEQVKNNILTLVDIIEHVAVTPGSSGYVQMNLRTAHPNFINNSGTITVTVNGMPTLINGITGLLKVGGGNYVGVGTGPEVLVGKNCLIVRNASDPLGYVYIIQQNGAWLNMDYSRVKASYMGVFMFYEGTQNINRSVIRIAFINITFGAIRIMGSGMLNLVARNVHTIVQTILVSDPNPVTLTVSFTGQSTEVATIRPTQEPKYPGTETIVYVVRMDVQIASL